jgi:hypothetical protein
MAVDKKSFVLYSDIIHTIKHLTDEQKGKLFIHILEYVNDENPTTEDVITNLSFEPIKQQLKRDLKKFEAVKEKRSLAGKKSAKKRSEQKATNSTSVESVQQSSTNSTVNDNVNVNVNVNDINSVCVKEKFTHESFIKWFNDCRKYLNLKSNIKRLGINEKVLFNELVKDYSIEDFKHAFSTFSKDDYYLNNNLIFPKNFLKLETFTKYLNTEVKQVSKNTGGDVTTW